MQETHSPFKTLYGEFVRHGELYPELYHVLITASDGFERLRVQLKHDDSTLEPGYIPAEPPGFLTDQAVRLFGHATIIAVGYEIADCRPSALNS